MDPIKTDTEHVGEVLAAQCRQGHTTGTFTVGPFEVHETGPEPTGNEVELTFDEPDE